MFQLKCQFFKTRNLVKHAPALRQYLSSAAFHIHKNSRPEQNRKTAQALQTIMHKNTVWVFWQVLWPPLGCSWVSHDSETLLPSHCAENQPGTLRKVTGWKSSLSPVTTCRWQIKCLRRAAAPRYVSSSITRTMVHLSSTKRSVQNLPLASNQIWESW